MIEIEMEHWRKSITFIINMENSESYSRNVEMLDLVLNTPLESIYKKRKLHYVHTRVQRHRNGKETCSKEDRTILKRLNF